MQANKSPQPYLSLSLSILFLFPWDCKRGTSSPKIKRGKGKKRTKKGRKIKNSLPNPMGPCMSLQRKSTLFKKRIKHDKKPDNNNPHHHHQHQENVKYSGKLRQSRPINVLKDPTGDDILKKYRLGKELGRGEFGVTYECFNDANGESLACKKISKSKLRTDIDVEDVRREVEIMRHLPKHPNIVRYKEVYEDKEAIYLVMELCEGGELFDRIVARGHYTERAAALVTKTILEVVKVCNNAFIFFFFW